MFDHEKLKVYQQSVQFVAWTHELLTNVPKTLSVHNQLERAATSVPLNIAEGNGKHTPRDRCKYFDTARGSALECAACLDVLVAKEACQEERIMTGKQMLSDTVAMLVGLIRANSKDREI